MARVVVAKALFTTTRAIHGMAVLEGEGCGGQSAETLSSLAELVLAGLRNKNAKVS